MSYAVRNDGKGWRAVNSAEDVGADEVFSETQPIPDPVPDPRITEIKAELDTLDFKRIRPIAEGDTVYLAELNKQVLTLRAELKVLTTPAEISVEIPAQEVIQEVANEPQVTP